MSDDLCAVTLPAGKVVTARQMGDFDHRAVEEFGVPSLDLMENAGRHVFEVANSMLRGQGKAVVVAGRGNNGGDGLVAARLLHETGVDVSVFLLSDPSNIRGDAKVNLDRLLKFVPVRSIDSVSELDTPLKEAQLIIDAIFGTGLKGEVTGLAADAIRAVNSSGKPVVAVDLPSGLDADTGRIWGVCVKADCTITFALPKIGLLTYPGAAFVGRLEVVDIGIPEVLCSEVNVEVPERQWIARHLPERPPDGHKGTFGTVLVIAGSPGLTGAAAMASEAALRSGAGLSTLAVPASLQDLMAVKLTEVMTRSLPETSERTFSTEAVGPAVELAEKATAVVLGCGLGTHPETCRFVRNFVKSLRKPTVIDADGLNCLTGELNVLEGDHGDLVLTPHPGEMGRLLGTSASEVQSNRLDAALEAASRFKSVIILKGTRTIIADPSGKAVINPTGNVGMATGGTGDVLAGIVGGLLAQGLSSFHAAACGTYVHGAAGDVACRRLGAAGMIAGDVLRSVPEALKLLYEVKS